MSHRNVVRVGAGAAVAALSLWVLAAPASAHVEPSPIAVQAGTSATITFGVEHGCGDSPLTKLEIQVPDGVTNVSPAPAPTGWTSSVADGVVTFEGGPQPAHEAIEFALEATFPDAADTTVGFPTVETCEEGSVSWIDPVIDGQEEPESPMPTVTLTAAAPTEAQLTPAEESEDGDHAEGSHDEAATTTAAPAETEEESSNTGVLIGVAVVVVLVAGAAALLVRRRRT